MFIHKFFFCFGMNPKWLERENFSVLFKIWCYVCTLVTEVERCVTSCMTSEDDSGICNFETSKNIIRQFIELSVIFLFFK